MLKRQNNCAKPSDFIFTLDVNVTKIVKYLCITGILIVGIIFGTKYSITTYESRRKTS